MACTGECPVWDDNKCCVMCKDRDRCADACEYCFGRKPNEMKECRNWSDE